MSDQPIDFKCKKCGAACATSPVDGSGAVCPTCCEDHDYRHDPDIQDRACVHCGELAPADWFDDSP